MHKYNKFLIVMGTMLPLVFSGVSFGDSFRMPSAPVAGSGGESPEYLSLPESAEENSDAVPAYIPDEDATLKFIAGAWEFDRNFVDKDGKKLDARFIFDESGDGSSTLQDEDGTVFEAKAIASLRGDKLEVKTSDYKSDISDKIYKGIAFKCDYKDGVTTCDSNDGSYKNVALLAADDKTRDKVRNFLGNSQKEDEGVAESKKKELEETFFTLEDEALKSVPQGKTAMVIPKSGHDMKYFEGEWYFDKDFTDAKGQQANARFIFDDKGEGKVVITTTDNEFSADAKGLLDDGSLKIKTDRFLSKDGKISAPDLFLECQNQNGSAVCRGTDGFRVFGNENMLASSDNAKENAALAKEQNESVQENTSQNEHTEPALEASSQFSELDSGSELPPDIMENVRLAKDDGSAMALAGDWRYSQDFSRKSDGDAVSLGFHFDKDGRGYSTIGDGKDEARAEAEAVKLKNGSYRVKTEAYKGKNNEYYPTFMECKPNENKEIKCNVSNGWLRLEDGSLIATDSLKNNKDEKKYEEAVRPLEPSPSDEPKIDNTESLLTSLAEESQKEAIKDDEKTDKSESRDSRENKALTLPNTDSTAFLNGKWSCNTGLYTNGDANLPVILDFAFDKNGKGTSIIREKKTGMDYKASVSATYNKNKRELRLVTSDFYNKKSNSSYVGQSIVCHQEGDKALCSGRARDGSSSSNWKNTPFMRSK